MRSNHSRLTAVALISLFAGIGGCRMFALPFILWGSEPTRKVAAEYPYLADKRVCVIIWADMETLFEYSNVQLELSEFLRQAIEGKVDGVEFVSNRSVIDLQRRDPDWDRADPAELGARLGADRVLMIELTEYGTREPDSPHLYRGRVGANVKVYDAAHRGSLPVYRTSIDTVYPPDSVGEWGSDDTKIRRATMEAFGVDVANKFYDRMVKVD